ncbi:MAG: hypothetical protein ACF8QF_00155 [Phycisphaerales bacterium]
MTVSLRHILTLVALVLMNSGVGRVLHTVAAHRHDGGHGAALTVEAVGAGGVVDALPEHDLEDCPQCDMVRTGAADASGADAPAWLDLAPIALLKSGDRYVLAQERDGESQPRAPPAA